MAFSDKQTKPSESRAIRKPSDKCNYQNCDRETVIAITLVRGEMGKPVAGAFSQFGSLITGQMRDGYTFLRYITRCAEHYQEDLERKRSGSLL